MVSLQEYPLQAGMTVVPGTVSLCTHLLCYSSQLLRSVRLYGTVQIYGALQGSSNVTFPVRWTFVIIFKLLHIASSL